MHDYHEGHPGYSDNQILHDGCEECATRAKHDDHGISSLDKGRFARAWVRAAQWNREGLSDLATAERPLLTVLWSIQLRLENYGVPIGELPVGSDF